MTLGIQPHAVQRFRRAKIPAEGQAAGGPMHRPCVSHRCQMPSAHRRPRQAMATRPIQTAIAFKELIHTPDGGQSVATCPRPCSGIQPRTFHRPPECPCSPCGMRRRTWGSSLHLWRTLGRGNRRSFPGAGVHRNRHTHRASPGSGAPPTLPGRRNHPRCLRKAPDPVLRPDTGHQT